MVSCSGTWRSRARSGPHDLDEGPNPDQQSADLAQHPQHKRSKGQWNRCRGLAALHVEHFSSLLKNCDDGVDQFLVPGFPVTGFTFPFCE
jgi:hypothetical protein